MTRAWCVDVTSAELAAATPHVLIDPVAMTADVDGVVYALHVITDLVDGLLVSRGGVGIGVVGRPDALPEHYVPLAANDLDDAGKIGSSQWTTSVALAGLQNRCAAVAPVLAAQRDKVLAVVVAADTTFVFFSDTSAARVEGSCRRHACHIVGPDGPYVPLKPPYTFPVLDAWENTLGVRGVRSYLRVEGNDAPPCVATDHDTPLDLTDCPRCMRTHGSPADAQACSCVTPTPPPRDAP